MENPGDKIAVDILEISPKDKVVMAIDYYSRKLFAKSINTKEGGKIVEFLEEVYNEFPFKVLLSDNGREFNNDKVKIWIKEKNIEHNFSVPYYHQSNGRIERANRTIRNAIKKSPGPTKNKLAKIIRNYNNLRHRGIGCTPDEAVLEVNREKIKLNVEKYIREFKNKTSKVMKLKKGNKVLIKNELKTRKMDDEFIECGEVIKNDYGDIYTVMQNHGKIIRRHISQLKRV